MFVGEESDIQDYANLKGCLLHLFCSPYYEFLKLYVLLYMKVSSLLLRMHLMAYSFLIVERKRLSNLESKWYQEYLLISPSPLPKSILIMII